MENFCLTVISDLIDELKTVSVQTSHICWLGCSVLSAAMRLNVVQGFRNGGISLIRDDSGILCSVPTHTARCLMLGDEALVPTSLREMIDDEVEGDEQEIGEWVERYGAELLLPMDEQGRPS
jgi:hypothetical protein